MIPTRIGIALFITVVCFLNYIFILKSNEDSVSSLKLNAILYSVLGFCWTLCLFGGCYKWYAYVVSIIMGASVWLLYTAFTVYPKQREIIGKTGIIVGGLNDDLPDGTAFYIGRLDENGKEIEVVSDLKLDEGDKFIITKTEKNLNYITLI